MWPVGGGVDPHTHLPHPCPLQWLTSSFLFSCVHAQCDKDGNELIDRDELMSVLVVWFAR